MNGVSYLRGLQLCYVTLRKTFNDIENIYFQYALKPNIRLTQPIVVSCIMCMRMMLARQVDGDVRLQ